MSVAELIAKVTGHPTLDLMGDLRYLCEPLSRGHWQFCLLTAAERQALLGKNRRIFIARPGDKIARLPAQTIRVSNKDGIVREHKTGTLSEEYIAHLDELEAQGFIIYQRVVIGVRPLDTNHGQHLFRQHGTVVPLTHEALVLARQLNWNESMEAGAGRKILARVLRESVRSHQVTHRAVRTMTGGKKVGRAVAGHNLVIAPHPKLLRQIQRAGQPIDKALEVAARRAIERMERKLDAKIVAVCSTHLQDSTGIRPHLHIRMSAYDSTGKYVRLFDRKAGSSSGNRCLLQPEIEREMKRIIERWEPRTRD